MRISIGVEYHTNGRCKVFAQKCAKALLLNKAPVDLEGLGFQDFRLCSARIIIKSIFFTGRQWGRFWGAAGRPTGEGGGS